MGNNFFFRLRGYHFQQSPCFCTERIPRQQQCTWIFCMCKMYILQPLFFDRSRSCRFSTLHFTALGSSSVTLVTNFPSCFTPSTDKRFILTPVRPDRLWSPPRFHRLRTECCFMGVKQPELQTYVNLTSNLRLRGRIHALPPIPSWGAARHRHPCIDWSCGLYLHTTRQMWCQECCKLLWEQEGSRTVMSKSQE